MPMNYAKTAMLLVVLTGIFVAMGALVAGQAGMLIAFAAALVMNVVSLWKSDTIVIRMFRGQEVDAHFAPELHALVRQLADRAELPMPKVYILPSAQPNAFATGRSPEHAAVAASKGLLETLSREELAGVIAHELAHIKNRDTLTMTVAATIGGAVSMLAQYLQFSMIFGGGRSNRSGGLGWIGSLAVIILAPFAAMLVQTAISRSREYVADRLGAKICGNPIWLASALRKINAKARAIKNQTAESIPAAAHMFIVNPLTGRGVDSWFSTHPNVDNRVARLIEMAREAGIDEREIQMANVTQGGGPHIIEQQAASQQPQGPWSRPDDKSDRRGPWG